MPIPIMARTETCVQQMLTSATNSPMFREYLVMCDCSTLVVIAVVALVAHMYDQSRALIEWDV